jgi:predicted phosphodiesterase
MAALILRFSDYETDTVEQHKSILSAANHVWWAWWKKQHETFPAEDLEITLRSIMKNGLAQVGLVNRATAKFFVASCVDLKFNVAGEPISSPEPERTPQYYIDKRYPAWFCFSRIEEVSFKFWRQEFGDTPVGDETFFFGTKAGGIPIPNLHRSDGNGILHISDLHFGSDFGFPQGSVSGPTIARRLEDFLEIGCHQKPAAVVISGDLTTRGEDEGFMNARKFIDALLVKLDLEESSLVIVPGNHDILIEDRTPTRDYTIEQKYRDFLTLVHGQHMDLERIHWIKDSNDVHYIFSLVNSSRPRQHSTMDYGYVGSDRSEPVLKTAHQLRQRLKGQRTLSTLVLHHHVLPASMLERPDRERPVSLTLDAGELVTLCHRYDVDLALHGHQHLPFIGYTGRVIECGEFAAEQPVVAWPPLWVLASGSTGAGVQRLGDEMRLNTFSTYSVDNGGLDVEIHEFSPSLPPRLKWDKIRLPLQA